jgi:hypothetical protein
VSDTREPEPAQRIEDIESRLNELGSRPTARAYSLFRLGCCQNLRPLLVEAKLSNALEVADRFVEGQADDDELGRAQADVNALAETAQQRMLESMTAVHQGQFWATISVRNVVYVVRNATNDHTFGDARGYSFVSQVATAIAWNKAIPSWRGDKPDPGWDKLYTDAHSQEVRWQDGLLGDLFGQPANLSLPEPGWLESQGPLVRQIERIYREQRFEELPALADALQQGGCREIATHCRAPHVHARGCWAIDWILGKS